MPRKTPVKRTRPVYSPDTKFDKLTQLQQKLVLYMYDNKCGPWDAVRAGVVSPASVNLWKTVNIVGWLEVYKKSIPPSPLDLHNHVQQQLDNLLQPAIRTIRDALVAGEGNATAVRAAQYVLESVKAACKERMAAEGTDNKKAEEELAAVLQLVKK